MENPKGRSLVLHPLLFAAAPILILYGHNIDQVPAGHMLPLLAASIAVAGVLWLALRALLKSWTKSSFVVSTLLALFFSYGHLHSLVIKALVALGVRREIGGILPLEESAVLHAVLISIVAASGIFLIVRILRTRSSLAFANRLFNVIAATLVVMSLAGIARYEITTPRPVAIPPPQPILADDGAVEKPDIYYIILDGYGRGDVLRDYYHFDNGKFLDFLRAAGFYVDDEGRPNYNWTFMSLASSLNMDYLDELADRVGRKSKDSRLTYEMIRNNRVVETLKSKGYRYVHFDSTWGATQSNPGADVEISYRRGWFSIEFSRLIASTTLLKPWPSLMGLELAARHLYGLDKLRSVCSLAGPKFVFYHLLPPHYPYVLDSLGRVKRHLYLSNQFEYDKQFWRDRGSYIEQLAFVNARIKQTVADILRGSSRPPVIVLQSDHGPTLEDVPWKDFLRARFGILNAVYFPKGTVPFLRSKTPVNTFRIIFNALFGADLPLLEERSFYSPFELPFDFREVTPPRSR